MQLSVPRSISHTSSKHNHETFRTREATVDLLPRNLRPSIGPHSVYPSSGLHNARSRSESGVRSLSSSLSPNPNVIQPRSRSSMAMSVGRLHMMKSQATEDRRRESQSIKDLAEFLRTHDPPPSNWMSIPESSDRGRTSKRPLWIFNRKGSRKVSGQERQIRLPDSAVASRTLDGHWHIAISIPNEYYPHNEQSGQDNKDDTDVSGGIQRQVVHNQNGTSTVTVLKPVKEQKPVSVREIHKESVRESVFRLDKDFGTFNDSRSVSGALRPRVESRHERNYVVVDSVEDRENATLDRRHSGGTIYSVKSLDEGPSHAYTQKVQTSETANQGLAEDRNGNRIVSVRGLEAPKRSSSTQHKLLSPESLAGIIQPSHPSISPDRGSRGHRHSLSAISNTQSVADSIDSNFSMGRISTADTAILCGPTSKTRKSFAQSQSGPPPDRKLPDLPESSSDDSRTIKTLSLPLMLNTIAKELDAPAGGLQKVVSQAHSENATSIDTEKEKTMTSIESRRDRVKALRNRDMAAQISRSKRNSNSSQGSKDVAKRTALKSLQLQDIGQSSIPVSRPASITPKRTSRRAGSTSPRRRSSLERKSGRNGLSSIMVVAALPPRCEYGGPRSVRSISGSLAGSAHSKAHSGLGAPTPPRSRAASIISSNDDDEDFNATIPVKSYRRRTLVRSNSKTSSHKRVTSTASLPQVSSTRKVTPPQKISKSVDHSPTASKDITAVTARTADLETRLAKVERSNRAMLQTVSAVLAMGKGLGELGALLPVLSGEPDILKDLGVELNNAKDIRDELGSHTSETETATQAHTPRSMVHMDSVGNAREEISKMNRPAIPSKTESVPIPRISRKAEEIQAVLKRLGMEMPSNLQGIQDERRRNGSLEEVEELMRELRGASRISLEGDRSLDDSQDSLSEYY